MSTITREFTKEQLIEKLKHRISVASGFPQSEKAQMDLELARIALASLEAEPVCVIDQSNLDYLKSGSDADVWPASRTEMGDVLLYLSAPPAPVSVPDEVTAEDCPAFVKYDITEVDEAWVRGFNACRAAMLQSFGNSEQLNSPVIPDGWVACSERMPEPGRWLALYGARVFTHGPQQGQPYEEACIDQGYLGSDGNFYAINWDRPGMLDDNYNNDLATATHWMYWELPAAPRG
ncbi:TPA: DUF551 domain-containing protein [Enterobacter kobei]|nr:DUF551 domain-containing protein [Enterobacter kobei]